MPAQLAGQEGTGSPASVSASIGKSLHLLFVGDSVTAGYFASTQRLAYPHLVAQALENQGRWVNISTEARPGATVVDAQQWPVGVSSDIVVVELGTNDHGTSVPLDEFKNVYEHLLRRVRAGSARGQLVCLGGWGNAGQLNQRGLRIQDYDLVEQRACEGEGGRFASIGAAYDDAANHGPDNRPTFLGSADWFHPNDRGHQELANMVLHLLQAPSGASGGAATGRQGAVNGGG